MKAVTSTEVFEKIKEMAKRTINPCRRIIANDVAVELSTRCDALLVLLVELENRGLVRIHKTSVVSVSLTNYGLTQNKPSKGLNSE